MKIHRHILLCHNCILYFLRICTIVSHLNSYFKVHKFSWAEHIFRNPVSTLILRILLVAVKTFVTSIKVCQMALWTIAASIPNGNWNFLIQDTQFLCKLELTTDQTHTQILFFSVAHIIFIVATVPCAVWPLCGCGQVEWHV